MKTVYLALGRAGELSRVRPILIPQYPTMKRTSYIVRLSFNPKLSLLIRVESTHRIGADPILDAQLRVENASIYLQYIALPLHIWVLKGLA